jgi:4-alpha-glucanotransferase
VAATGTHDTDTLAEWWRQAKEVERHAALAVTRYLEPGVLADVRHGDAFVPAVRDALLEAMYASGSDLLILPVQDVFGWTDRINVPALVDDTNWTWRLPWPVDTLDAQPDAAERQQALRRWSAQHARA